MLRKCLLGLSVKMIQNLVRRRVWGTGAKKKFKEKTSINLPLKCSWIRRDIPSLKWISNADSQIKKLCKRFHCCMRTSLRHTGVIVNSNCNWTTCLLQRCFRFIYQSKMNYLLISCYDNFGSCLMIGKFYCDAKLCD